MLFNQTFSCVSPCKVNDFLYIVGKTPNGYHKLQTLFTVLEYGDLMSFSPSNEVLLNGPFDFPQEQNLIYKAAMLLKAHTAVSYGVKINVVKRLPEGGGLGGGSSNAATVLLVLNKLWDLRLTEDELIALGVKLGADVPLFIKGTTTFGQGIGDILEEVSLPKRWYLVVNPGCKIPTKELFASADLKRDSPERSLTELLNTPFNNCFTPCVVKRYPQVQELLDELSIYNGSAFMSGSGSSCFARFNHEDECRNAFDDFSTKLTKLKVFMAPACTKNTVLCALNTYLRTQCQNVS